MNTYFNTLFQYGTTVRLDIDSSMILYLQQTSINIRPDGIEKDGTHGSLEEYDS